MKSYRDSEAYQRSNRVRIGETRPAWPLTAADRPSLTENVRVLEGRRK